MILFRSLTYADKQRTIGLPFVAESCVAECLTMNIEIIHYVYNFACIGASVTDTSQTASDHLFIID